MKELEIVKKERLKIQYDYLLEAESIWKSERLEAKEKDKQVRMLYNKYQAKDKFLEGLEARLESCLADIEYYDNKYGKK